VLLKIKKYSKNIYFNIFLNKKYLKKTCTSSKNWLRKISPLLREGPIGVMTFMPMAWKLVIREVWIFASTPAFPHRITLNNNPSLYKIRQNLRKMN